MPFKYLVLFICRCCIFFGVLVTQWATAGMLVKADIDRLFDQQYLVTVQPDLGASLLPVWRGPVLRISLPEIKRSCLAWGQSF
jgi:hypothetical protein